MAEFAGQNKRTRKYLLEGHDEKLNRQDNSILEVRCIVVLSVFIIDEAKCWLVYTNEFYLTAVLLLKGQDLNDFKTRRSIVQTVSTDVVELFWCTINFMNWSGFIEGKVVF